MSKTKQLDPVLVALKEALTDSGDEGQTARQLAKRLRCSKPTVYARIERLKVSGVRVRSRKIRDGGRGPKADAFSL